MNNNRRRLFVILLVLCFMLSSFSGCNSTDYKKAVKAFNNGDYENARAIFVQLDGYKNSSDMILKCDYEHAKAAIDEKEYDIAIELLETLPGYEDSDELLRKAKWSQLHAYIQENGTNDGKTGYVSIATKTNSGSYDGWLYLYSPNEETICFYTDYLIESASGFFSVKMEKTFDMQIAYDNPEAQWVGNLDTMLTGYGNYGNTTEYLDGIVDLPNARVGSGLTVVNAKNSAQGSGTGGQQNVKDSSMSGSAYQKEVDDILMAFPGMMKDIGCSMTLKDLGFTSMS